MGLMKRLAGLGRGLLPRIAWLAVLVLGLLWFVDVVAVPQQTVTTKVLRVDRTRSPTTQHEKGRTGYQAHVTIDGKEIVLPAQTLYPLRAGQQVVVRYKRGRFTGAIHGVEVRPARVE